MIDGLLDVVKRVYGSVRSSMSQIDCTCVNVRPAFRMSDARVTSRVNLLRDAQRLRVVGKKL
jgi:hypothetical protein